MTDSELAALGIDRVTFEARVARAGRRVRGQPSETRAPGADYDGMGLMTNEEFDELVERKVLERKLGKALANGMQRTERFEVKDVGGGNVSGPVGESFKAEHDHIYRKDALMDNGGIKGLRTIRQRIAARRALEATGWTEPSVD